ncbi:hypothetical protein EJ111_24805 [Escherichia coli]|nr:hypothetical protein EJ111_24805 [Escherichia coli]
MQSSVFASREAFTPISEALHSWQLRRGRLKTWIFNSRSLATMTGLNRFSRESEGLNSSGRRVMANALPGSVRLIY